MPFIERYYPSYFFSFKVAVFNEMMVCGVFFQGEEDIEEDWVLSHPVREGVGFSAVEYQILLTTHLMENPIWCLSCLPPVTKSPSSRGARIVSLPPPLLLCWAAMAKAVEDLVFCRTFIVITQHIPGRQSTGGGAMQGGLWVNWWFPWPKQKCPWACVSATS